MDRQQLFKARQEWETFLRDINDAEKNELSNFTDSIDSNSLHYFAYAKDAVRFDQTINRLSKRFLYEEDVISTVYNFYVDRDLHELAFDYLIKAEDYIKESGTVVSESIQLLLDRAENKKLLSKLKFSLEKILTLTHSNIPFITPDAHNDKRVLGEFILHELILASKVMLDKIHAVATNPHEDRYNDLLLAILRLRFPIWGWSIHDQARTGSSATGLNAGETDITIQAKSITIALIEALILNGKNKIVTEHHLQKIFSYSFQLKRYYIIIYYKGALINCDNTWTSYKEIVKNMVFPINFTLDLAKDFQDISSNFDDVNQLKVAKTTHDKDVELFHLMINMGT